MKTADISPLVTGVLVVIGIALSLGQYGRLEHWARYQAIEAMQWKQGLPNFFAGHHAHGGHARPHHAVKKRPDHE